MKRINYKILFTSLLFFIVVIKVSALNWSKKDTLQVNDQVQIINASLNELPDLTGIQNKVTSTKLNVKLTYNDNFSHVDLLKDNSSVHQLDLTANFYNEQDELINATNFSLNTTYDNPEQLFEYNFIDFMESCKRIEIIVDEGNYTGTEDFKNYLQITSSVDIKYGISTYKETGETVKIANVSTQPVNGTRRVKFYWECDYPYVNYDLQVLRVYNNSNSIINKDQSNEQSFVPEVIPYTSDIDWGKALHVEVKDKDPYNGFTEINLGLAESGYYLFRVRPVGDYYKSEKEGYVRSDSRNFGSWNSEVEDGQGQLINQTLLASNQLFQFEDPAGNLNYTYQRVFTEEGHTHEVMSFANGLNQVKQTQTYLSSNKDKKLIVTQSIYDYSGRPSLSTLPVPTNGDLNTYKEELVKQNNELYTANNFDKTTSSSDKVEDPDEIEGEINDYYSSTNNVNIPDANGYPYTRSIYMNDGTGRVLEQSGVGIDHKIGSGHTVKYEYSQPSDDELVRVFGEEALPNTAVLKTVVTDANGDQSVSYTTNEGTVIATALSYDESDVNDPDYPDEFNINNRLVDNEFQDSAYVSEKEFVLSQNTALSLFYNLKCEDGKTVGCFSADFTSCRLALDVILESQTTEGDTLILRDYQIQGCSEVDLINEVGDVWEINGAQGNSFPQTLSKGRYRLIKKLKPGVSADDNIQGEFTERKDALEQVAAVIKDWLSVVSSDKEMLDFYKSVDTLGSILASQQARNNGLKYTLTTQGNNFSAGQIELDLSADQVQVIDVLKLDRNYKVTSPNNLILKSSCCGEIIIPLNVPVPVFCPEVEEDEEYDPLYTYTFIDYLFQNALYEVVNPDYNAEDPNSPLYLSEEDAFELVCPGYTKATLARMLYHMLNDKYNTGGADGVVERQYECEELWDCWKGNVSILNDLLEQYRGLANDTTGANNMSESQESDEEGGTDDQDEAADEGFNNSPLMAIIEWLYGFDSPADELRSAETASGGTLTEPNVDYNFVNQFLDCAGYKFAKIITWEDPYPLPEDMQEDAEAWDHYFGVYDIEETVLQDQEGFDSVLYDAVYLDMSDLLDNNGQDNNNALDLNKGYNNKELYFIPEEGLYEGQERLLYPYIKNPVFAFKYFEYGTVLPAYNYQSQQMSNVATKEAVVNGVTKTVFDYPAEVGLPENDWPCFTTYPTNTAGQQVNREDIQDPYDSFGEYYNLIGGTEPETDLYVLGDLAKHQPTTRRWYITETSNCFVDYSQKLKECTGVEDAVLCENSCEKSQPYPSWKSSKLFRFYKTVSNNVYEELPPVDPDQLQTEAKLQALMDSIGNLEEEAVRYEGICKTYCEDKRQLIKQRVLAEFLSNCYEIDDCADPSNPKIITEEEIDIVVDDIVNDCKANRCDSLLEFSQNELAVLRADNKSIQEVYDMTFTNGNFDPQPVPNWDYPTINYQNACYNLLPNGIFPQNAINVPDIMLFSDCQWNVYDQVRTWDVQISLPEDMKDENCETATDMPVWVDGMQSQTCVDGQVNEDNIYADVKEVNKEEE